MDRHTGAGRNSQDVVSKFNREINKILKTPNIPKLLFEQGFQPVGGMPEQFATYLQAEKTKWGKLIKASGAHN